MKNFHYNAQGEQSHRKDQLFKELQEIERDLEHKNRLLNEKKLLEEQFYEDNKNINIADEIMDELLGANKRPIPHQDKFNYPNLPSPQPQHQVPHKINEKPLEKSNKQENNYLNKREMEKMKLQNQNAGDFYPFGRNDSRQKPVARSPVHAPERDNAPKSLEKAKRNFSKEDQPFENPFIRESQALAKKREEEERNYRRVLEEQMEEQKKRKKKEEEKYKQQFNQAFNSYVPSVGKSGTEPEKEVVQNVVKNKKRDPNGDFPVYSNVSSNVRNSDKNFMRMQVEDLKNKFKKGRINHEEYESQCKKLQLHYDIKIKELEEEDSVKNNISSKPEPKSNQLDKDKDDTLSKNVSNLKSQRDRDSPSKVYPMEDKVPMYPGQMNNPAYDRRNFHNLSDHAHIPQRNPQQNYSHLTPHYNLNSTQNYQQQMSQVMGTMMGTNPTEMQLQMMMKIFEEFKNIIKYQHESQMDLLNEKKLWHETIAKMNQQFTTPNSNMYTQQVPPNNLQNQREYFSDVKKFERFDQPRKIEKNQPQILSNPYGDSETSNSYIEKSLSGIVNKIPLTKKQKEKDNGENSKEVENFYQRKYKVKKFKQFQYTESPKLSSVNSIPSVSNYIEDDDSQNELNHLFQKDLVKYKRLQKDKEFEMMKERVNKNKSKLTNSEFSSVNQSDSVNLSEIRSQIKEEGKEKKEKEREKEKNQGKESPGRKKSKSPGRNYRKLRQKEEQISNPFLKKHISNESYQPPTFQQKDFKDCDFVHSPQQKSSEILEQEEYQTEPRKNQSESEKKTQNNPFEKKKKQNEASMKLRDIMKTNNELLSKYDVTPSKNSLSSIRESYGQSSKAIDSGDFFSGHDISPVQRKGYESSLQTVRSEEESGRLERKNNMDLLMMGAQRQQTILSQYNSPVVSVHASPSVVQNIELTDKKSEVVSHNSVRQSNEPSIAGYSQTVESINESSSKFPSFHRPPLVNQSKKVRSISRKKESVVKLGGNESRHLSNITSEGSREKSSLPHDYEEQSEEIEKESIKFDSNVYQSGYEASVSYKREVANKNDNYYNFQPKIMTEGDQEKEDEDKQKEQGSSDIQADKSQQIKPKASATTGTHKWKSLEEARKIAREFRQRSGEDHNRSSVEQKLSELQSFIHISRKDDSILKSKVEKEKAIEIPESNKKDILKILDDLGEEEYEDDFNSYKEESER